MSNRFQIQLDVNEYEVELLCDALEQATLLPSKSVKKDTLNDLKAKINLAWIEREDEIHKSPSEGYPTREMVRRWYRSG